jgi:CubicO group peptidase (beta-lactamase class C family)
MASEGGGAMRQRAAGRATLAALALALLLAACAPAAAHRVQRTPTPSPPGPAATAAAPGKPSPTPDPNKVCSVGACLAFDDWADGVVARIDPQAVGYGFAIIAHGQVARQRANGQARTAVDGALAFSPEVQINIASLTKTLTAVAVIRLLDAQDVGLDAPIAPYLPADWTLGPNADTITFRELLTHTSGLRGADDLATSYDDLRALIARGIALGDKTYAYQNQNFALFRVLIPGLRGVDLAQAADPAGAASAGYLSDLASVYGQTFPVACKPGQNGAPYALAYSYPAADNPGTDWGDWTATCGGGGLYLSLHQLSAFLARLTHGAYVSGTELQTLLYGHMGWDYTFADTSHGTCFVKNGSLYWDNDHFVTNLSTLLVYCPQVDLGFAAIANSKLNGATTITNGQPGSWDDLVQAAYEEAWR